MNCRIFLLNILVGGGENFKINLKSFCSSFSLSGKPPSSVPLIGTIFINQFEMDKIPARHNSVLCDEWSIKNPDLFRERLKSCI